MLKTMIKALEEVDEKYRDLYEKTDDGYTLTIDDSDYKTKLNEFRTNNITLSKAIEKLKADAAKVKDIDPVKYKTLQEKVAEFEDKELLDKGNVDELLEQRTERMRQEYADKMTKLSESSEAAETTAKDLKQQLDNIMVSDAVTRALNDTTETNKGAVSYIQARAATIWKIGDKGLEARDAEGNLKYGKDGKEPLVLKEWINELEKESPFLFKPNTGGNAPGNNVAAKAGQTIGAGDKEAFASNIEEIAKGNVTVV